MLKSVGLLRTTGIPPGPMAFCRLISCRPCGQRLLCICDQSLTASPLLINFTNLLTQEAFSLTVLGYCHMLGSNPYGATVTGYIIYSFISYFIFMFWIWLQSMQCYMVLVLYICSMYSALCLSRLCFACILQETLKGSHYSFWIKKWSAFVSTVFCTVNMFFW